MRHRKKVASVALLYWLLALLTCQVVICLQQQQISSQPQLDSSAHIEQQQGLSGVANKQVDGAQQQVAAAQLATLPTGSGPNVAAPTTPVAPKSNHRLVNKIKDARHRRRHRYRQRHFKQKSAAAAAVAVALLDTPPHAASSTLTALESIVEEVSRAGQQPSSQPAATGSSTSGQSAAQSPPSGVSPAAAATEVLLDGSSSAVSLLQPAGVQPAQAPQTAISVAVGTRPPGHNSRGSFFLTSMLSKIMNVLNVTEFALEMRDGISSRASCMACNAVVGLFLSPLYSKEVFSAAIRTVCTSFKITSARVCAGLVESFQDDFEYIRKNTKLTRDEICAVVFGVDCARRQTYNLFWTVPIPASQHDPGTKVTSEPASPTPSLNEQNFSNLDDAPDLFEYRKSSIGLTPAGTAMSSLVNQEMLAQQQQSTGSSTQRPSSSGSVADHAKLDSKKSGKMLPIANRPQYIFDDETESQFGGQTGARRNNERGQKISSFVHITDIHIDPYYEAGSLSDCNEPLCCRATSGPVAAHDKRRQAGRWGDYGNCDTPVRTLRSALNRIRQEHSDAEYWLWTGDISPHDIWNISKSEAANHVRLVTRLVRDYSNGLPVFPVIGNHEAHPVNSFSPPEIKGKFSMSWLYDVLADEWSNWLPKDALDSLRVGGYYKLQVRKGFRIIALNTNYCARLNPWSFYDPVDPANQLKWLVDQLLEAELNQDKVHIVGHVPPDNRECTQAWLFNFINIVDRFKETIVGQFYGHTHRDEWRVMYSLKRQDAPIGVQFIGPSITPFTENNPAYRIYHQDKSGYLVDSETYFFNLTEANESQTSEPNWKFSYSTRAHMNMTQGLSHVQWHNYLQKLHDNEVLFDSYFKNYYRSSDVKLNQVCKTKCKYQMLSDLRLSHPYKTKPKPFLANRKTSNHHRDRHEHAHYHQHHKRLRHSD